MIKPISVFAADLLLNDVCFEVRGNPGLEAFIDEHHLRPGEKVTLNKEQHQQISELLAGHPVTNSPGESSANTLVTFAKLMQENAKVKFLGVLGEGTPSIMSRGSLEKAGIELLPLQCGKTPEIAVGYIMNLPDGESVKATYPGNAREIITHDYMKDNPHILAEFDAMLIQGSLWQKYEPSFADELLRARWDDNKELWLTMPTNRRFATQSAGKFRDLVHSADVVLSNEEELCRIFNTSVASDAYDALRDAICKQPDIKRNERKTSRRHPVAFITNEEGANVITAKQQIVHIPRFEVPADKVIAKVGAGDTAFGGFLLGHVLGLDDVLSAKIGLALASEVIQQHSARLDDPMALLQRNHPSLARLVEAKSRQYENLTQRG